ncbi:MAG TPA: hypothetical protein VKU02_19140 [Gemmataceae bacterium]|nr:hypothetical protein [Gemmataceae bacterium]
MRSHATALALVLLTLPGSILWSQEPVLPPGEKEPLLRLEAGGPTSYVTALAFSSDGQLLYVGGWDKVVRVWRLNNQGQFVLEPGAYRVPLGPGLAGAINSLALSEDGNWLAVAGLGVFRGAAGFRQRGWIMPSDGTLTPTMRRDEGTIYVFNTAKPTDVRILRGHLGPVVALAFAPASPGKPPILVSAAKEWDEDNNKDVGAARIWDVAAGKELADGLWGLPNPEKPSVRPALAAWHTGNQPKQVRVALAWEDERLRFWDVERTQERVWNLEEGGKNNNTAAYWPDQRKLITGSFRGADGQLHAWDVSGNGEPRKGQRIPFPSPEESVYYFPRALSLFSARADGKLDYAAVALRKVDGRGKRDEQCVLDLVDLRSGKRTAGGPIDLWSGSKLPVLATAPRSQYLAIAGNDGHDVLVYAISDLLAHRPQFQKLQSIGTSFHFVAFVKKGKDLGLLLNEAADKKPAAPVRQPQTGDLIFDFGQRQVTADRTGWIMDRPALNGWRAESLQAAGRPAVAVYQGNRQVATVKLKADQVLTHFALLSPQPALNVPILAIASHQDFQPVLSLYNAATGEQVRALTGHQGLIYGLAFSGDGRFLVSVAEDQTACVWSLTNLPKLVGQYGQLPGVAVQEKKAGVVVTQVEDDSPAQGKLQKGDVLEGLVQGDKVRPTKSFDEYFEAVARTKPGTAVVLNARGSDGPRKVRVEIRQLIDERKPLLSLFIARNGKPEDREWIGWNPIGPYDASGRKAERHLGWHFNTGKADGPTRFALADEYRKEYYREGLLKELIAQGDFQRVPPAPPPLPPELGLVIEEQGTFPEPDSRGQILVRHPEVTLQLVVHGRPLSSLKSLTWQLDNQAEQKFNLEKAAENEFTVPLRLRRGMHKLRVVARTPEAGRQEYVEELSLRYQPPPPQLEGKGSKALIVRDPEFVMQAVARPGLPDEAVTVQFSQRHENQVVAQQNETPALAPGQPLEIKRKFQLQPGNNLIEIVARNRDALPEYQETETARLAFEVTLIKKARPPLIVLESVLPQGSEKESEQSIEPGKTVLVHAPKIAIRGKIDAEEGEKLVKAERVTDPLPKATELARFASGKEGKFVINEEVTLQPGPQTVHFRAKTANSDEADRPITVLYQPPVPPLEVITPQRDAVQYGDKESEEIALKAQLAPPGHPYPFQAKILRDGQELPNLRLVMDNQTRTLTGQVPLHPGNNRFQVQLSNSWGAVSTTEDINVSYLRPPEVLAIKGPQETKEPFIDLSAVVRSSLPLLLNSVIVEVNGKRRDIRPVLANQAAMDGTQVVLLKNVPLDADKEANEISVRVANQEAECCMPGTANIQYRPVKSPPVVQFLEPHDHLAVNQANLKVRFQVRSAHPLQKAQFIQDDGKPIPVDLSKVEPNPDGSYEVTKEVDVQLRRGLNTLHVVAANDGGEANMPLIVNYPDPPVRLSIDSLLPIGAGNAPVPATAEPGGTIRFPAMSEGRVRLRGHVVWDEKDDARLKATKVVRVFVNGFQQLPAELEAAAGGGRERAFRTDILLNQAAHNQVEIALPGLEQDASNRTHFLVDCKNPARAQRLYVLPVSPRETDADALKTEFEQTMGPVFDEVEVYTPRRSRRCYVLQQLQTIRYKIEGLAKAGLRSNTVVVFYYQGGESVDAQGNLFQTTGDASNVKGRQTALTCEDLVSFVAQTPGAHVLFFDVEEQKGPKAKDKLVGFKDNYPEIESHVALMRYAWLGSTVKPEDTRLIRKLQEAIPQSTRLIDLAQILNRLAKKSQYFPTLLRVDEYIPEEMRDLAFNKKNEGRVPQ